MVGIQKAFFPHEQLQCGINVFIYVFLQIWHNVYLAYLNIRNEILGVQILEVQCLAKKNQILSKFPYKMA